MKVSEVVSKTMKIEEGDSFEIYTDGNEQINLKKYSPIQNANVFFKELINKYGKQQLVVAIEELSELQKEICKSLRDKTSLSNLCEEIADVYIMLAQLKIYYDITDTEINKVINQKIERTKERYLKG